jgi:hypothetical protein
MSISTSTVSSRGWIRLGSLTNHWYLIPITQLQIWDIFLLFRQSAESIRLESGRIGIHGWRWLLWCCRYLIVLSCDNFGLRCLCLVSLGPNSVINPFESRIASDTVHHVCHVHRDIPASVPFRETGDGPTLPTAGSKPAGHHICSV